MNVPKSAFVGELIENFPEFFENRPKRGLRIIVATKPDMPKRKLRSY
jgi:hypothetical protein